MAEQHDVDLVEIAPAAVPPVCRLMDYGKFRYQEQKRQQEAKAKQKIIQIKEVKFRPTTDEGDYQIKLRNMRRFIEEGDKIKLTVRFKGREMAHTELGVAMIQANNKVGRSLMIALMVSRAPRACPGGAPGSAWRAPTSTCRPVRIQSAPTQYALFRRYLARRHASGGMADMSVLDYSMMVEDSAVETFITETAFANGWVKLGQPVPLSNLVPPWNSGSPHSRQV